MELINIKICRANDNMPRLNDYILVKFVKKVDETLSCFPGQRKFNV